MSYNPLFNKLLNKLTFTPLRDSFADSMFEASKRAIYLADEAATADYAAMLAKRLKPNEVVFFSGELGAGKTTLIRQLLRRIGVTERVKSPTYSLVENYQTTLGEAFHLDLYRLASAQELAFITGRSFWTEPGIKLVEWPDRFTAHLPTPNYWLKLSLASPAEPTVRIAREAA